MTVFRRIAFVALVALSALWMLVGTNAKQQEWFEIPCVGCSDEIKFTLGIQHQYEINLSKLDRQFLHNLQDTDLRDGSQATFKKYAQVGQIPSYIQPVVSGATYTGPGDVPGVTWSQWGSCAFVFTAAQASTSTSMCDLVAVTGGAAVCTLRGSASGAVDQTAYCPGSLTPAAACTAASGGSCLIAKVYDQTSNANPWVQATLASMPIMLFSGIQSKPTIEFSSSATSCAVSGNVNLTIPFVLSAVLKKDAGNSTVNADVWSQFSGIQEVYWATTANSMGVDNGAITGATVSDGISHKIQVSYNVGNTGSNTFYVDGSVSGTGTLTYFMGNQPSTIGLCGTANGGNRYLGEIGTNSLSGYSAALDANILARWGL